MRPSALIVVALGLLGCATDDSGSADRWGPADFAREQAAAACALYEQCDLLSYYGATVDSCERNLEHAAMEYLSAEGCTFDAAQARACLNAFAEATCDPGSQGTACDDVCGES